MPRSRIAARFACLALVTMLSLASTGRDGRACGYHDNVSIARGALNWAYPDSLHVIGAISAAVAEKRLVHESAAPDLFGAQYRVMVKGLEQLAVLLRRSGHLAPSPFSLVIIEPMLWTRFAGGTVLQMQPHLEGPQAGDLIVVSGEDVIRAVAAGRLSIGEAHDRGLLRLYGDESQTSRFLEAFSGVGGDRDEGRDPLEYALHPSHSTEGEEP